MKKSEWVMGLRHPILPSQLGSRVSGVACGETAHRVPFVARVPRLLAVFPWIKLLPQARPQLCLPSKAWRSHLLQQGEKAVRDPAEETWGQRAQGLALSWCGCGEGDWTPAWNVMWVDAVSSGNAGTARGLGPAWHLDTSLAQIHRSLP